MLQSVLILIKQAVHFIACFMKEIGYTTLLIEIYIFLGQKMTQTTVHEENISLF
jgi:hypothetical protein